MLIPEESILESFQYNGTVFALIEVTPALASKMLEANLPKNKIRYNHRVMIQYKDTILMGAWEEETWEPIHYSSDGYLINGQHRLKAIEQSGKTVRMLCIWGVTPKAFPAFDIGYKRSSALTLTWLFQSDESAKSFVALAALARLWYLYKEKGVWWGGATTPHGAPGVVPPPILAKFMEEPLPQAQVLRAHAFVQDRSALNRLMTESVLGMLTLLFEEAGWDYKVIDSFWSEVEEPKSLTASPTVLRQKLFSIRNRGLRYRPLPKELAAVCIKAFNAYLSGKEIKGLQYNIGGKNKVAETFPEVVKNEGVSAIKFKLVHSSKAA